MWLIELLVGMFLGYYVVSKDFRNFVNCLVFQPKLQEVKATLRKEVVPEKPKSEKLPINNLLAVTQELNKAYLEVTDEQIQDWISKNPDLKKANEVAKWI